MYKRFQWFVYDMKRLHRLWIKPERSVVELTKIVGVWWLMLHGVKREYKVILWRESHGWYSLDFAIPRKKLAVEADGSVHNQTVRHDITRDQRLSDKGWQVLRISVREMRADPRKVKRQVRKFLKG